MLPYFWVFLGSFLFDVIPLPLPPAFTIMVFFQIRFGLDMWLVILFGVVGSVLGRYLLTLYIPLLSYRIFNAAKNEEVQYLGKKFRDHGFKGQLFIFFYSLMPFPTTPLFIAGGMAKLKPISIIIPFLIGKFISDSISVIVAKYATENTADLLEGLISWKTISGFVLGLLLLFMFVFIDWSFWLTNKKIRLRFKVWK